MTKQLLNGTDVDSRLEQVSGKRVTQGVNRRRLGQTRSDNGRAQVALQALFMHVMPVHGIAARILGDDGRRKHPEPGPACRGARILDGQRVRHPDTAALVLAIVQPVPPRQIELLAERRLERTRQHDDAVLATLAVAHDDDLTREVDVLDTQAGAFEQAHPGAVQQAPEQRRHAFEPRQHCLHFGVREHHRQALSRHRSAQRRHPRHVDAEHLTVEKEQRAQRLAMRARRDVALIGEHRQIGLHLDRAQISGMAHAGPAHEVADPVDVGLFRP